MGWNQFEKLKKKNPREIERLFLSLLLRQCARALPARCVVVGVNTLKYQV
jgi:hypothetical protein